MNKADQNLLEILAAQSAIRNVDDTDPDGGVMDGNPQTGPILTLESLEEVDEDPDGGVL